MILSEIRSLPEAYISSLASSFRVLPSPNTTLGQANLTSSSTRQSQHTSVAAFLFYSSWITHTNSPRVVQYGMTSTTSTL